MAEYSALIDEIIGEGSPVICAVDQSTFSSYSGYRRNYFSLLRPLTTVDGRLFKKKLEEDFPDRGRLWWLLRDDIELDHVVPGMLWTVFVEKAPQFKRGNGDKRFDFYQARFSDAVPGATGYCEVLPVPRRLGLDQILRTEIEYRHPPTSRVVLAHGDDILGPFAATWSPQRRTVSVEALSQSDPVVHRLPKGELGSKYLVDFKFVANEHDRQEDDQPIDIRLLKRSGLEKLTEDGEALDAASDAQVVNWVVRTSTKFSREDTKLLRAALDAASDLHGLDSEPAMKARLDRFQRIANNAELVLRLGETVAAALAEKDEFSELIEKHVERLTEDRVAAEIDQRKASIESETKALDQRKTEVQAGLDALKGEYAEKRAAMDAELRDEQAARIAQLESRESSVDVRERQLLEQEEKVREQLNPVISEFRDESQKYVQQVLGLLPFLEQTGVTANQRGVMNPAADSSSTSVLTLPEFLHRPKPEGGPSELEFIQQFRFVCRQQGFLFEDDDLANFHNAVKSGLWTVLAGSSGTGKSSLPRLYAAAMGGVEELLWIPVRPDWMDDRDVLGAYNAFVRRFEPAASGLVDRLIAAHEDLQRKRGGLYLIALDEMNLAKVEHYFAQFLSLMELPPEGRFLKLFAKGQEHASDPYAPYRNLPLHSNVRFIGTVNIDHTTQFFSPKVIDRAAILLLEEPKLGERPSEFGMSLSGLRTVDLATFDSWCRTPDDVALEKPRELLSALNAVLSSHRCGLGHRAYQRVLGYVASSSQTLPEDRAFDFAFAQIILPRLRNTTLEFHSMLEALREKLPRERFRRSHEILTRLLDSSEDDDFFQVV